MIPKPVVSVVMITYGHEYYIAQAIKGVLMQKCDFEVELIIANDCSPDETNKVVQNIIETYPNGNWIKHTRHKENKGMYLNFLWAIKQCKGEFIAICEGDDYWIDPNKLQKQVDFLKNHRDFGLVAGGVKCINTNDLEVSNINYLLPKKESLKDGKIFWPLFNKNFIYTLTVCFRKELMLILIEKAENRNLDFIYDYWFWLNFSLVSKIKIFQTPLANYRIHAEGVTRKTDFFSKRKDLVKMDILKTYFSKKNTSLNKDQKQKVQNIFSSFLRNKNISIFFKLKTVFYFISKLKFLMF